MLKCQQLLDKFRPQLSEYEKKFYNLGAWPPDKSVWLKICFVISQSNHMCICVVGKRIFTLPILSRMKCAN